MILEMPETLVAIEIAYQHVTHTATQGALGDRWPRPQPPDGRWHTIMAAAEHVMMAMNRMDKIHSGVVYQETGIRYNAAQDQIRDAFNAVSAAAEEAGIEIRPGTQSYEDPSAMTEHMLIEALKIPALLELAEAETIDDYRLCALVAMRDNTGALRQTVDE